MRARSETALHFAHLLGIEPAEAERRKTFLGIDARDAALLKELRARLAPALPQFIDAFFAHLLAFEEAQELLKDPAGLERARQAFARYFDTLTGGDYGWVYVQDRLRLGVALQRIGLKPKLHIGSYGRYLTSLLPHLFRLAGSDAERLLDAVSALIKIIFFDLNLILETYNYADRQAIEVLRANAEASERRYRDLVEGLDAIVYEADGLTRRFSFVSPRAEVLLGYPTARWLAEPNFWINLLHPDDWERTVEACLVALHAGRDSILEYRARTADGRELWLQDHCHVLRDETGTVRQVRGLLVDITERKRAEENLHAKTDQLEALTEALTVVIRGGNWDEASQVLIRESLRVTDSESGFIGAVIEGPVLRVLAWGGLPAAGPLRSDFVAQGLRTFGELGHFDFPGLDNLLGWGIAHREAIVANDVAHDPRAHGLPPGHLPLRRVLGVPILQGGQVVGLIAVANRPGDYGAPEQAALELIARTAGVLYDRYRRVENEAALSAQLLHAQKMESLGLLAGGVAHDFNNLLSAIIGFSDLLDPKLAADPQLQSYARSIHTAGQSAAALTRRLLAFSRRQVLKPEILDLNDVIGTVDKLLRRTIGEQIELVVAPQRDLGAVRADRGQIEQVLMNLAVNARDAMPGGGKLTIEVANVELDAAGVARHVGARPGPYVMLAVSDTGCGMEAAVRARLFEPFFTTKEPGLGTGLGLATVYGIVKQSDGYIWVYSEPKQGTTFKIYLPRVDAVAPVPGAEARPSGAATGTETVLVVDDSSTVRYLVCEVLRGRGYTVLEADHPEAALRLSEGETGTIHLLLTDVVMPGMNGLELARRLTVTRPDLRVVYMSGYPDNAMIAKGLEAERGHFLQKPLSPAALAETVRAVLDGKR